MRKKVLLFASLFLVFILTITGCTKEQTTVKDREGNDVVVPEKMERIISTAPSNTEVLVELGLADKLVAVDKYSKDVKGVPSDIEYVDFSNPDAEAIIALEPDMIIASGHNKSGENDSPFELIEEAGISVFYIPSSDSINGIYEDIKFMASLTNKEAEGDKLIASMQNEIEKIKEKASKIENKKSVYFEIGPAPNLYSFGNSTFLNEMIELVGAKNVFADEKAWISPTEEAVLDKNPDVILTNVNYVESPVEEIKSRKGWENINAVKNGQVYLIDKNSSSRPSQNIIKALNEMAKAIYPEVYGQN